MEFDNSYIALYPIWFLFISSSFLKFLLMHKSMDRCAWFTSCNDLLFMRYSFLGWDIPCYLALPRYSGGKGFISFSDLSCSVLEARKSKNNVPMCHCNNSPQFPTGNHFYFVGFVYWNINLLSGCISVVLLELIKLFCLSYLEQNLLTGLD